MSSIHALIIEDNPLNLEVIRRLLAAEQVTCTAVQDPTELEDTLRRMEHIDLVFLDLELPEIDGYEVLAFLRDQVGLESPIVAYTMHTNEMNNARRAGFHSFLGKPLRVERFHDQLKRILSDTPVWEIK